MRPTAKNYFKKRKRREKAENRCTGKQTEEKSADKDKQNIKIWYELWVTYHLRSTTKQEKNVVKTTKKWNKQRHLRCKLERKRCEDKKKMGIRLRENRIRDLN